MTYDFALEARDYGRIDKLNKLTNVETFFDDVRKLTKKITNDHTIHCWERLSELRWAELNGELDNYYPFPIDGLSL